MPEKTIQTVAGSVSLSEDGIEFVRFFDNREVVLADVVAQIDAGHKLIGQNVKLPVLVDISNIKTLSREARLYVTNSPESVSICKAVALLVGSPITSVIGNFFMGLNKPVYPLKLFNQLEEAVKWLKSL